MGGDDVLVESWPAVAETVPRARWQIAEFAISNGASGECLDDIRLAVSEALTNVVVHAYPRGAGEVHVTGALAEGDLWVLISDDGQGLQGRSERPGLGLGLALIAQLCDEFAIVKRASGGTELRMRFALPDEPFGNSRSDSSLAAQDTSGTGGLQGPGQPGRFRGDSQLGAPA